MFHPGERDVVASIIWPYPVAHLGRGAEVEYGGSVLRSELAGAVVADAGRPMWFGRRGGTRRNDRLLPLFP